MCRTEQVLLLSDDLTSTLINTSFNFGLKIKAFIRGEMLVSSILLQRMFPIFEFISLFSYLNLLVYSQNLNAGGATKAVFVVKLF